MADVGESGVRHSQIIHPPAMMHQALGNAQPPVYMSFSLWTTFTQRMSKINAKAILLGMKIISAVWT